VRYQALGASGLTVSRIGLGANNFGQRVDLARTRQVVDAALDAGISLIDTADMYGERKSESFLGEVLEGRRDRVVLATKFGMDMGGELGPDWGARGSRRYIRRAVEASLRKLRTDWIDLYQYHVPDGVTPVAETLAALDEIVREGKVRYVGSSNLAGWQVADADWSARSAGRTPFISAQNNYSLLDRSAERELVPACAQLGIGILPYFPLASGLLSGKYRRGKPAPSGTRLEASVGSMRDRVFHALEKIEAFAQERGVTMLDVAIGWLASRPTVGSVIAGATRPEQVEANVAAGDWEPSAEDCAALDAIVRPGSKAN
jgi:aryl-alcohol dehydrogenase-like predicted oxidoreductase